MTMIADSADIFISHSHQQGEGLVEGLVGGLVEGLEVGMEVQTLHNKSVKLFS